MTIPPPTVAAVDKDGLWTVPWYKFEEERASLASRSRLTADTTYYVATTGSDAGGGSSGDPWATIQHAWDYIVASIDLGGFTATIQLAAGTYTDAFSTTTGTVGAGRVIITGHSASDTTISSVGTCLSFGLLSGTARVEISDLKFESSAGFGLLFSGHIYFAFDDVDFGACPAGHHIFVSHLADGQSGNYTISGAAVFHWVTQTMAIYAPHGGTVTITGTPAFTTFAVAQLHSIIVANAMTFVGGATGPRFSVATHSHIETSGGGANYLPGNSAGTEDLATFGLYT